MASAFTYDLGVSQGRIQPQNASPVRTSGASTSTAAPPYDFTAGGGLPKTLRVVIDGGTPQDVVFSVGDFVAPGAATNAEVLAILQTGGQAGAGNALDGATAAIVSSRIRVTTNTPGAAGSVDIDAAALGPDANDQLVFPLAAASGTGGNFLFCLGSDLLPAPSFDIAVNDLATVEQAIDLTGIRYVRGTFRIRQPATVPQDIDVDAAVATVAAVRGSVFPDATQHARLVIGAGASRVTYHARELGAGGATIRIAHVNPGDVNQALAVKVLARDIEVYLATDGAGALTSTANAVAAAVDAHLAARLLVEATPNPPGTGVAPAQAITALALTDDDVSALTTSSDFWTSAHVGRLARIAGSGAGNNGDHLIVALIDARTVLVATALNDETPLTNVLLVGAAWEFAILVDGTARVTHIEPIGSDKTRVDLAAHVSKLAGVHTVTFRTRLVEI